MTSGSCHSISAIFSEGFIENTDAREFSVTRSNFVEIFHTRKLDLVSAADRAWRWRCCWRPSRQPSASAQRSWEKCTSRTDSCRLQSTCRRAQRPSAQTILHTAYSSYSITERRVPEPISVLGSQPAGDVSHKPGGRLPLLSARPTVSLATLKRAVTNFAAW